MVETKGKFKFSRDLFYLIVIVLLIALCGQFYFSYRYAPAHAIEIYYSKDHILHSEIIEEIQNAEEFVYFSIYTFTRNDIKDALLGAKHRGVVVKGLTDRGQVEKIELQGKIVKELRDAGIDVDVHNHSGIMHTKTVVTEKAYATGSYNWTAAASDSNDEVLEVGKDSIVRDQYENILKDLFERYDEN